MANHKSAVKRSRQNNKKRSRNKAQTSAMRTMIKKVRTLITEKKKDDATKMLPKLQSTLFKLANKGIIKKNNASRKISRISNLLRNS